MLGIWNKSFENINESDIQTLIDIEYKENQNIEYKKEIYSRGSEGTKEMLRDINAFANAYGGALIIGIEEDGNGIPTKKYNINNAEQHRVNYSEHV